MKEILAAIWKLNFKKGKASLPELKMELKILKLNEILNSLLKKGLIEKFGGTYALTQKGRKKIRVAVCGGVFDILHPGHGFMLSRARQLGDVLVVIVARDSTVASRKRIPIVPQEQRVEMLQYLRPVDIAVLGEEGDPLKIVEKIRPDVIVLGPDQHHDGERIKEELKKRGINVKIKKVKEYKACFLCSTRSILQKIIERGYPNERVGK